MLRSFVEQRSHDRTRELLHQAARERHGLEDYDYSLWVRDVYDDNFVYSFEGRLWQSSYSIGEENEISMGEDVEVEVSYTVVGDGEAREAGRMGAKGEEIELIESGQAGHFSPLIEKAVRRDGTIPIKIISPGWGSSGYYPEAVLERDAEVFAKGTKMYWDHPTASEEVERPERSLRDLAAELVSDARWEESGVEGPGVYADAKVFEAYQPAVDEMAPHIGVSINALGYGRQGEAEGEKGHIVEQLVLAKSVDFVTEPGRGGQIVEMFEAARPARRDADAGGNAGTASLASSPTANVDGPRNKNNFKENKPMDELQELQESVTALNESLTEVRAENARLREAQTLRDAEDQVSKALAGVEMPEMTRERLVGQIAVNPPLTEGKTLDVEALNARIEDAVKREAKYLASLGTAGQIVGMGDATPPEELTEAEETEQVEAVMEESFASMGLSEAGAKVAAAGR
ncbi:MAG: hypothetical protein DWQ07_14120 [Chloroflexi bacterium]|nr:MAG: hypothetical protein DWQ07_14120 [Chloroflexota bacterium]